MMPDHLHAILFVKERLEKPLGKVLLGVKQACNQVFREVMPEAFVAVAQQHAEQRGRRHAEQRGRRHARQRGRRRLGQIKNSATGKTCGAIIIDKV
ncbi:MAG: hypothetical protein IJV44_04945 [Prevotella sp.]|nr:hypothetical protein [Prevotella sp.]